MRWSAARYTTGGITLTLADIAEAAAVVYDERAPQ